MNNDLILDIKKAAKKIRVSKKKLISYLLREQYIYKHNVGDKLKPYIRYTRNSSNYFVEKIVTNDQKKKVREMFFTEEGIEFFKRKMKDINKES